MSEFLSNLHQAHVARQQRLFPVVPAQVKARAILASIMEAQKPVEAIPKPTVKKRVFNRHAPSRVVEIEAAEPQSVHIPVSYRADGRPSMAQVIAVVANFYSFSRVELCGPSRKGDVVMPRHIAVYLCREYLKESYPRISRRLGRKEHTSSIFAYRKVKRLIEENAEFVGDLPEIKSRLGL